MRTVGYLAASLLAGSALLCAQSQSAARGWPSAADSPYQNQAGNEPPANYDPNSTTAPDPNEPPPPPPASNQPQYGPPGAPAQQQPIPSRLTIPAGTYITVRVNQALSSDRNQRGDAFAATLAQPLVVNGIVVAEPGQTVGGQVTEAQKAGHIEGVARLGVQLTELTLVDGQQVPIKTQFINRSGPTSVGRDAAAIGSTTALGAAVGAAAGWGKGAAIGAGAGAAAGILGVLVTRGEPSVIHPEQVITFRLEAPVSVSTEHAPYAFRYIQPNEYERPQYASAPPNSPYYGYAPPPPPAPYPYYAYPYYAYSYPYYWGPSFGFYIGPRYYYRGWYGRPYYGGHFVATFRARR